MERGRAIKMSRVQHEPNLERWATTARRLARRGLASSTCSTHFRLASRFSFVACLNSTILGVGWRRAAFFTEIINTLERSTKSNPSTVGYKLTPFSSRHGMTYLPIAVFVHHADHFVHLVVGNLGK